MKTFLLGLVMCLTLTACSSSDRRDDILDIAPVDSARVVFIHPDDFDQNDRAEVLEAVREHTMAWSTDFNRKAPLITIEVLSVDEFICSEATVIGCAKTDRVIVVAGEKNSLPALYHEMCHFGSVSRFHGRDGKHLDGSWPLWTERSYTIANALIEKRSWW